MEGVQASQILPPWLSLSTFTTLNANGAPTTEATVVYLPLTYFGPSIPLGTNGVWVFGGSTSPLPSSTPPLTSLAGSSVTSPPTASATSSTLGTPSTGAEPSVTSSSTASVTPVTSTEGLSSTSNSITSTATLPSLSGSVTISNQPSSTAIPSSSKPRHLSARSIIAIAIVSAFAFILLFVFLLLWWRRRRRSQRTAAGQQSAGSWSAFEVVDPEEGAAHDVVPTSGERESDALVAHEDPEMTAAPPYTTPPRLVTTVQASHPPEPPSAGSSHNSSAPIGIALADRRDSSPSSTFSALMRQEERNPGVSEPSLFYRPPGAAAPFYEDDGEVPTIALSPAPRTSASQLALRRLETASEQPRVSNPDILPPNSLAVNLDNSLRSSRSTMPSIAYPDSPVSDVDETAALMTARRVRVDSVDRPATWGLGAGLARLSRLSWFNRSSGGSPSNTSSSSRRQSRNVEAVGVAVAAPIVSTAERQLSEMRQRQRDSLLVSQRSELSGSSGQSVYYDAPSRPRSLVEPNALGQLNAPLPDVLDIPAPPSAMTNSVSSGSARSVSLAYPPGLPQVWSLSGARSRERLDNNSDTLGLISLNNLMDQDQLDDHPPMSVERWDTLRSHIGGGASETSLGRAYRQGFAVHNRHSTFSEHASLHSMRSHIGAHSSHSAGSRATSHHTSSHSSKGGTGSSSLNYSNSVTSDGRRPRVRRSAEGSSHPRLNRVSMSAVGRHGSANPLRPSVVPTSYQEESTASRSSIVTGTQAGTSSAGTTTMTDPSTGAVMHFPTHIWQPHQSDSEWPDDAWTEFPTGGAKWWGPPSSLQVYRAQTGDRGAV